MAMHEFLLALHHIVSLVFHTLDMLYQSLVLVGAIGVAAQAVFGFVHLGGHHSHAGPHAHAGGNHAGTGGHAAPHAGNHAAAAHGQHTATHAQQHQTRSGDGKQAAREGQGAARWLGLLSPLTLFSFLLGMGLTGLLVRSYLTSVETGLAATAGGFAFYRLIVRPMWGLALRFASKPAETLSGAVATEAEAMSRFDAQGRGMVRVTVDGEVKRLLAYLEPDDREKGIVVTPGDRLVVTSVDGKKNTCRVTRL
jgi:hypothetical protein